MPREQRPRRRHVSVRIDEPTLARLDALAVELQRPGASPVRSEAILAVLLLGLDVHETRKRKSTEP
jgi:hypothetical protein